MEKRMQELRSKNNKHIKIGIIPGHFATNHSHVNYYVDLNGIKRSFKMARDTAKELAAEYINTPIDTIICLEGTQMLGAFLAEQLSDGNAHSLNSRNDIYVLTPELNSNNQMIFRDDSQGKIWNKNILLLISSASTGWTINRCVECLKYYNGSLVGVAALFSAIKESDGIPVKSIFTTEDITDYNTHLPGECPMCKEKRKVDAIINAYGYSKL